MYTNVQEFKDWWIKSGRPLKPPFKDPIHVTDIAYALCLYREKQFQVELYICKPNTESPAHKHPNIHSISMYLTGDLTFLKDGKFADLSMYQKEGKDGAHFLLGQTADANDGTDHALKIGSAGGSFLIFEHWLKDTPVSVTTHWEGELVGDMHAATIGAAYVE
jgi:hypothetical protein